ncbi:hypothetical protein [Streptosporangium sp. NPDC051022]|uniref:hypothetical protein n=1 Tax=Streptosporangium sp. NPDC051022 TaxID=3155752 RepID=UPI00342CC6D7
MGYLDLVPVVLMVAVPLVVLGLVALVVTWAVMRRLSKGDGANHSDSPDCP